MSLSRNRRGVSIPADGHHERGGRHREAPPRPARRNHLDDPPLGVGVDLGYVRVQQDARVRIGVEARAVAGEGRRRDLQVGAEDAAAAQRPRRVVAARAAGRVVERRELADLLSALVEGHEVRPPEWPAGVRHAVALFEVDLVERAGVPVVAIATAPVQGAAPEGAHRGRLERVVRIADAPPGGLAGRLARALLAPRFEDADAASRADQLRRDDDAGRAGSDDAEVCLDVLVDGKRAGIDEHLAIRGVALEGAPRSGARLDDLRVSYVEIRSDVIASPASVKSYLSSTGLPGKFPASVPVTTVWPSRDSTAFGSNV